MWWGRHSLRVDNRELVFPRQERACLFLLLEQGRLQRFGGWFDTWGNQHAVRWRDRQSEAWTPRFPVFFSLFCLAPFCLLVSSVFLLVGSLGVHTHMCLCGFLSPAGSAPLAEPQVIENVVLRGGINHTGTGGFIFPQNKPTGTKSGVGLFQGICLHSCGTWLSMSLGQAEKIKTVWKSLSTGKAKFSLKIPSR